MPLHFKFCKGCGIEKPVVEFYKRKDTKVEAYATLCIQCDYERRKKLHFERLDEEREYNRIYSQKWYWSHLEHSRKYQREWKQRRRMEQMKYAFENAKIITKGTTPNTFCRVDGMKVRMAREGRWTRKDLATIANVGTNLIEQMEETPTRTFKRDKVEQVAKAISLPVEQLIVYEGKRPRSPRGMRVSHNKKPIPFIKKAPVEEVISESVEKPYYSVNHKKLTELIDKTGMNVTNFEVSNSLSNGVVRRILNGGTKYPTKETMEKLAEILNVNVSDIVMREKFRADHYKARKRKRKLFPGGYKKRRLKNAPIGTIVEYAPTYTGFRKLSDNPFFYPLLIVTALFVGYVICGVVNWL